LYLRVYDEMNNGDVVGCKLVELLLVNEGAESCMYGEGRHAS